MTDDVSAGSERNAEGKFDLVVDKSTDTFKLWQQLPAWVLGGCAILGGAALIAFPKHQTSNAWAAVIIAVFLAAILSYRSAFTLNDDSKAAPPVSRSDQVAATGNGDVKQTSAASESPSVTPDAPR